MVMYIDVVSFVWLKAVFLKGMIWFMLLMVVVESLTVIA